MLTIRTMPIAARATNPVLMMALSAFKHHMPQLTCAAALNRAEHFTLLECDLCCGRTRCCGRSPDRATPTPLQKRLAMLPQTVGDCGHGSRLLYGHRATLSLRWFRSWTPKQIVDHTSRINRRRVGQMQIDHRRLQAAVAEILLDQSQRNSGFVSVARELASWVYRAFASGGVLSTALVPQAAPGAKALQAHESSSWGLDGGR